MVDNQNIIDLSFFNSDENKYCFTVLIALNRPIVKEMYLELKPKINFVICADGAANRMYDDLGYTNSYAIPDCIVGDFDSIRPEVQDFYGKKNVKLLKRMSLEFTDLEKSLYVAFEKILDEDYPTDKQKRTAIVILGASGGRIDHTFSAFSQVYKYINSYEVQTTDIFMLSKSSLSVYLKLGQNKILNLPKWENKHLEYSIVPLSGGGIVDVEEDDVQVASGYKIKFGEDLFFSNNIANQISIWIKPIDEQPSTNLLFVYSFKNQK